MDTQVSFMKGVRLLHTMLVVKFGHFILHLKLDANCENVKEAKKQELLKKREEKRRRWTELRNGKKTKRKSTDNT